MKLLEQKVFSKNLHNLINIKKPILVGVSGGVDSMVLLDLLMKENLNLYVAHVNFQLRENASNSEEEFIKTFCYKNYIPFYNKKFDVYHFSKKHKCSVQMAARNLRYKWFYKLAKEIPCSNIAVGHHLDDSIETFFLNCLRGTGIKGLIGIPKISQILVRPLLIFTRDNILSYAKFHNIKWIEDASNYEDKYLRNSIRNNIIPCLYKISKNFLNGFSKTLDFLKKDYELSESSVKTAIKQITRLYKKKPFFWDIDIKIFMNFSPIEAYLFRIFRPYGFNIKDLKRMLYSHSGKQLFSDNFRLIKSRHRWLLTLKKKIDNKIYQIKTLKDISIPIFLSFSLSTYKKYVPTANVVSVDFDKIKFPLFLRKWKIGDDFFPFGSKHKKKVSKFFQDERFSLFEKENIWLLINEDNDIIWLVGSRLDDRYQISINTNKILNFKLNQT